eukprot:TRINITY_DN19244_c0_g1_i1.p1 TRINITY_DN19244_c0_g1~~TRINITY_DN19244_c0_g1_i1.p1  ORF type:complete len:238 (-),score=69.81 TRINITY_DN19244_c0_g1_i1:384-1046(-)
MKILSNVVVKLNAPSVIANCLHVIGLTCQDEPSQAEFIKEGGLDSIFGMSKSTIEIDRQALFVIRQCSKNFFEEVIIRMGWNRIEDMLLKKMGFSEIAYQQATAIRILQSGISQNLKGSLQIVQERKLIPKLLPLLDVEDLQIPLLSLFITLTLKIESVHVISQLEILPEFFKLRKYTSDGVARRFDNLMWNWIELDDGAAVELSNQELIFGTNLEQIFT